jgi:serine/threonine-protein kinase RsbW
VARLEPVRLHWLPLFVLVALGYVVGYKLAQNWFSAEDQGASFFPPAGLTLGALVLLERRQWWIVLAAAGTAELALDLDNGTRFLACLGLVLANVTEPLAGALLLGSFVAFVDLRRTRDLAAFLLCAVVAAPAVGAAIAATTFVVLLDGSGWGRFALEWWSGDGLGVLVVGSALIALRPLPRLSGRRAVEATVLAAAAAVSTAVVFEYGWFELVYLPIALLLVVAFRVGTAGVAVTGAAVAFLAAGAASEAKDFWSVLDVTPANRVLYLQLGLAVVIAAALALAAEISERERIAGELARSEIERGLALERAELYESERTARLRAELLEQNAVHLVEATTIEAVARSTIADLGLTGVETASIGLRDGDVVRLIATSGIEDDLRRRYLELPLASGYLMPTVARTGETISLPSGAEYDKQFPGGAEVRRASGLESAIGVPLPASGDEAMGALVVSAPHAGAFDEDRATLIQAFARQCGAALERVLLQVQAERATADAELLARLGEVLERAISTSERARALVDVVSEALGATVVVSLLEDDATPTIAAATRVTTEEAIAEDVLLDAAALAIKSGRIEEETRGGLRLVSAPLRARGRALGVLSLASSDPRLTRILALRLSTRAAIALDNALLYEQERSVSHSLQLSLLGGDPPAIEGARLATAYLPGSATLEVGGDWYDVFDLPGGRHALVVGDVVGHGLDAAKVMGQLRGAVRALAPLGSASDLLENLDVFVESLPEARMATVAYADLDPTTGRISFAAAGHPPPLIAGPSGARLLWAGRSAPLGSSLGRSRTQADDIVRVGETLVLYTDGLIERRRVGIDEMLDVLVRTAGAHASSADAEGLVDALLADLLDGDSPDDVCVLALRRISVERFERAFPASPTEITELRHALDEWLVGLEIGPEPRRDLVLAVSEAAVNAAEHAYEFDGVGVVSVEVRVSEDGDLRASISDSGRWRPPADGTGRGHGTQIIRALMDDVSIKTKSGGTVVHMQRSRAESSP